MREVAPFEWELPREPPMRVPGRVFASRRMVESGELENAFQQVRNVAHLPGIIGHSLAMPDIHWGYGFPIGGVAAFDSEEGVLSPGGVGYDINCGVRLLSSRPRARRGGEGCSADSRTRSTAPIPVRRRLRRERIELRAARARPACWRTARAGRWTRGYGDADDLERVGGGRLHRRRRAATRSRERANERGRPQLGSLGSGNHFSSCRHVDEIYDEAAAAAFGLARDASRC